MYFPMNFCKIFKNNNFVEHLRATASKIQLQRYHFKLRFEGENEYIVYYAKKINFVGYLDNTVKNILQNCKY